MLAKMLKRLKSLLKKNQTSNLLSTDVWLVVGLGNPGPNYSSHRHNIGRMVLHAIAEENSVRLKRHKAQALVGDFRTSTQQKVILVEPESYMNLSGNSVASLTKFYNIPTEQLIVIHDELDLEFGKLRLKHSGGHAGHNGLRSIVNQIGPEFIRLRMGIGRPKGHQQVADFVLSNFNSTEKIEIPHMIVDASEMVLSVINEGLTAAQQRYHH